MSAGGGGGVDMDGGVGMVDEVGAGNGVSKSDWLCCIGTRHGGTVSLEGEGNDGDCTEEEDGWWWLVLGGGFRRRASRVDSRQS